MSKYPIIAKQGRYFYFLPLSFQNVINKIPFQVYLHCKIELTTSCLGFMHPFYDKSSIPLLLGFYEHEKVILQFIQPQILTCFCLFLSINKKFPLSPSAPWFCLGMVGLSLVAVLWHSFICGRLWILKINKISLMSLSSYSPHSVTFADSDNKNI